MKVTKQCIGETCRVH